MCNNLDLVIGLNWEHNAVSNSISLSIIVIFLRPNNSILVRIK